MGIFDKLRKSQNTTDEFTGHLIDSDFNNFAKLCDAIQYCKLLEKGFFDLLRGVEQLGTPEANELVRHAKLDMVIARQFGIAKFERDNFCEGLDEAFYKSSKEFEEYIKSFPPTFYDK